MKVLKKGRSQKGWAKEYECSGKGNGGGGCGAWLLVEAADVFFTASHHYDGSSESYITFECPDCHVLTDINDRPSLREGEELLSRTAWLAKRRKANVDSPTAEL